MAFDFMHRKLDEILVNLSDQSFAHRRRIGRTDHSESARSGDDGDGVGFATRYRTVEAMRQRHQKDPFRFIMPVGLLDGAARRADRRLHLAGPVGPLLMGPQILLLAYLL